MSVENPYAPTLTPGTPYAAGEDRERLRQVAAAQRLVNIAALVYLALIPVNIALRIAAQGNPWAGVLLGILGLSVFVFGAIAVYRLAALLRGPDVAVIYAIGLLIPLVGLILLLTLSQSATKLLKERGIRVGLLGADPATIGNA